MVTPAPTAIGAIDDPEKIRVVLYASGESVHAPLVGAARAALSVSDFALTLLDDVDAATMRDTMDVPSRAENTTLPCGRLTLVAGVAVPESDAAGATTIYYVPAIGHNLVPIYDGSWFVGRSIGAGLSLALDNNTGHSGMQFAAINYDVFVFDDAGTVRMGSWPWVAGGGSDTSRGTGSGSTELELFNGLLVNKTDLSLRWGTGASDNFIAAARRATYVGSFRPTANGQASDTAARRLLYNAYNKAMRPLGVRDVANSWTYDPAVWRQANGNAANKVEILAGLTGDVVSVIAKGMVYTDGSAAVGIGLDSVTGSATESMPEWIFNQVGVALTKMGTAEFRGFVGLGYHYLSWLEQGSAAGAHTWFGTNNDTAAWRTGIFGSMLN